MIFITVADVDLILGSAWAEQDKKDISVLKANTWLSNKKFCSGTDPIDDSIKMAGSLLAQMASKDQLYVNQTDGLIAEKTVKADVVSVSKKYVAGSETGKSSDMQFIDDLLSQFLCSGGATNTWVCK